MSGNTIGKIFKVTTWGESHGSSIGCIIDGVPAGVLIDFNQVDSQMARRAPGQSSLTTPRKEADKIIFMSGLYEGVTTGVPIAAMIENSNVKSGDYDNLKNLFRPGHADFTYYKKFGIRDHRGGGRSSARTTAAIVAAGAVAKQVLTHIVGIEIYAYVKSVCDIKTDIDPLTVTMEMIESTPVRCPDEDKAQKMIDLIETIKSENDSVGGVVECVVKNVPAGVGEPVFDKLEAELAKGMLSINASKGFEIGDGFASTKLRGSENNDKFVNINGKIVTQTNHAGGVIGGISTGMPIIFRVAFKPTPTIGRDQETVTIDGESINIAASGRHDPCVLPRAVPVVEAMAAIILLDNYLIHKAKDA